MGSAPSKEIKKEEDVLAWLAPYPRPPTPPTFSSDSEDSEDEDYIPENPAVDVLTEFFNHYSNKN